MNDRLEDVSDWEALRRFRAMTTDTERLEQMFMTALAASRTAHQSTNELRALNEKVAIQNGRIGKLETRWLQTAAILGFLVMALPIIVGIAAILAR